MSEQRCFRDRWVSEVLSDTRLDFDVRGLLASIAEVIMNPSGMNMYASQSDIARRCSGDRAARKRINRMLGEAAKAGVIRWEEREDGRRFMIPVMNQAVPESGHEPSGVNTQKSNPGGKDNDEFIRALIVEVWSTKAGTITQQTINAALVLLQDHPLWTREQVATLVQANAEGANYVGALRARLERVAHHPTFEKAMNDPRLRSMLGLFEKQGHRANATPGVRNAFGESGRLAPDDPWFGNRDEEAV